ncbi:MAG: hypothetical protein Q4B71_00365 [Cardiobacteriaceae bacterium]|nr:hypothetical protein [Cardiobacteriaceae bacterium]
MSSLLLSASLQLAALDAGTPNASPRTFAGVAHSGKPFVHNGKRCVVDLSALQFAEQIPVLIEHDRQKRAGVARLTLGADGLIIAGTLLSNEHGKTVSQDADEGFPWQLSAHLQPTRIDEIKAGQSALVNGQTVHGEIAIYRNCLVREVSFTPTGVDNHTHAVVLSESFNPKENQMNLEEALAEIANLKNQIQTLAAEKQKLEQEKEQAKREQDLNAELSARGFQKDAKGQWLGLSDNTKALLLSLDKAQQSALLADLAPKAAPKALFEPHQSALNTPDVKLSDNPLLQDAEQRAKQSAFI